MKNVELTRLLQGINAVDSLSGVRFAYAMSKNKKLITSEVETLEDAIKYSDEFEAYEKDRIELCERHAEKDDKGKPKTSGDKYVMADQKKFDKGLEALNEKNKEVIERRKKQGEEYGKLLEVESSYEPFMVEFEDVPKDITVSQMDGIIELIKE